MPSTKIYTSLIDAMRDIQPIAKERKNDKHNYKFRGVDDVMNELQPIFAKHGIVVLPEVVSQTREERKTSGGGNLMYSILMVKFYFYADDGSFVSVTTIGEGMDSGDKASNKAMAAALKYALLQTFCIPTEDPKDSENDNPPPSVLVKPQKQPTPAPAKPSPPEPPICPVCNRPIEGKKSKNGAFYKADDIFGMFGMCVECNNKTKATNG